MLGTIAACAVTGAAGLVAGTLWGRKLEQKAVGRVMFDLQRADSAARAVVTRLTQGPLPWLEKHLHL